MPIRQHRSAETGSFLPKTWYQKIGKKMGMKSGKPINLSKGHPARLVGEHPFSVGAGLLLDAGFLLSQGMRRQTDLEEAEFMAQAEAQRSPEAMAQNQMAQILMQQMGVSPSMSAAAPNPSVPGSGQDEEVQQVQQALAAVMGQKPSGQGVTDSETLI